jgi:hypothetical protein
MNKGARLRQIGFDDVEGGGTSFYEGWPHFAFNAPLMKLYMTML